MANPSGAIPISERTKNDGWVPNPRDLSTTPGGGIYATTPGGTKIRYHRDDLLAMRNSPLSKTPTKLPMIPGVTAPDDAPEPVQAPSQKQKPKSMDQEDPELFQMDQ
eukprot:TRINITY_DN160_c0_g1_i1.p1 TRINITY_DN160_c0_g1~~TRINITY_DN160_c0_g1_i1.p1  ORF type:complete len:107 (+),score=30.81 TRINITY_DN160_c0_g1_i1:157-477(+)